MKNISVYRAIKYLEIGFCTDNIEECPNNVKFKDKEKFFVKCCIYKSRH